MIFVKSERTLYIRSILAVWEGGSGGGGGVNVQAMAWIYWI